MRVARVSVGLFIMRPYVHVARKLPGAARNVDAKRAGRDVAAALDLSSLQFREFARCAVGQAADGGGEEFLLKIPT